jgi:hypothetical protein
MSGCLLKEWEAQTDSLEQKEVGRENLLELRAEEGFSWIIEETETERRERPTWEKSLG